MQWPADYHMHTPLCRHAVGEPVEYAAKAIEAGLEEIGFSDHAPMRQDDFDDWRMRASQLEDYMARVEAARKQHPRLRIKLALEVDYLPGQEDWIKELASRHPWDYLIGSVHYVEGGWDVDNPHRLAEWERHEVNEVWRQYLERLIQAAETGLFNIIGHCDLPKKFGHRPTRDCSPQFRRFFQAAARHQTAIELNTAGLRKDCREIYPALELLKVAGEEGVPITFGSDAHAPAEVGAGFGHAIEWARAAGYRSWLEMTQRKAVPRPL